MPLYESNLTAGLEEAWECLDCGALIADMRKHDWFHDSIVRAVSDKEEDPK